jgi:hypothetical protein
LVAASGCLDTSTLVRQVNSCDNRGGHLCDTYAFMNAIALIGGGGTIPNAISPTYPAPAMGAGRRIATGSFVDQAQG